VHVKEDGAVTRLVDRESPDEIRVEWVARHDAAGAWTAQDVGDGRAQRGSVVLGAHTLRRLAAVREGADPRGEDEAQVVARGGAVQDGVVSHSTSASMSHSCTWAIRIATFRCCSCGSILDQCAHSSTPSTKVICATSFASRSSSLRASARMVTSALARAAASLACGL